MSAADAYNAAGDASGSAGAPPASAASASADVKPAVSDTTLTIRVKDQVESDLNKRNVLQVCLRWCRKRCMQFERACMLFEPTSSRYVFQQTRIQCVCILLSLLCE